jgi:hypothetical protein
MESGLKRDRVELLPAFHWICDGCSHDNFIRATTTQPPDGVGEEMREVYDDAICDAQYVTTPETVKCDNCGKVYFAE